MLKTQLGRGRMRITAEKKKVEGETDEKGNWSPDEVDKERRKGTA